MKNKLLLLIIVSLVVLPNLSLAESGSSDKNVNDEPELTREAIKDEIEVKREERKKEVKEKREAIENERESIKDRIENKREELKQELEQKREEIKNKVEERRQNVTDKITERVNQFVEKIVERFNTAANRLDILVIRIESRIDKIEARGIDVTKAKNLLVIAKTKIETAKKSISLITIPENVSSDVASTTASSIRKSFETTRAQIRQAKNDLKAVHAALIDVVKSLKPGNNKLKEVEKNEAENGSTSTTTNNN